MMQDHSSPSEHSSSPIPVPDEAYLTQPIQQDSSENAPSQPTRPIRAPPRVQEVDSIVRSAASSLDNWAPSDRVAYPSWIPDGPNGTPTNASRTTTPAPVSPSMPLGATIHAMEDGHLQGHKVPTAPWQRRQAAAAAAAAAGGSASHRQPRQSQVLDEVGGAGDHDGTGSWESSAFGSTPPKPAIWAARRDVHGKEEKKSNKKKDDDGGSEATGESARPGVARKRTGLD